MNDLKNRNSTTPVYPNRVGININTTIKIEHYIQSTNTKIQGLLTITTNTIIPLLQDNKKSNSTKSKLRMYTTDKDNNFTKCNSLWNNNKSDDNKDKQE